MKDFPGDKHTASARLVGGVVLALLALLPLAAGAVPGDTTFSDSLVFAELPAEPPGAQLITSTDSEEWYYVPAWSDLRGRGEGDTVWTNVSFAGGGIGYRGYSPLVVRDRRANRWSAAGVSQYANAVYPVQPDPYNPDLIWFGCNDGPALMHADGPGRHGAGTADDPLLFSGRPGGLGVIDLRGRTVSYFGMYRHLTGSRVSGIRCDSDVVWIWGQYPLGGEPSGFARYDRATGECRPFPIDTTHSGDPSITVARGNSLILTINAYYDWQTRAMFDTVACRWLPPTYVWPAAPDARLYAAPDTGSAVLEIFPNRPHYGGRGHGHFGHPLLVVAEDSSWYQVLNCTDTIGWLPRAGVCSTFAFMRLALNEFMATGERGNDGPRMFLARAHLYLTAAECDAFLAWLQTANTGDTAVRRELAAIEQRVRLDRERAVRGREYFAQRGQALRENRFSRP